jgi:hypothetical protein
VRAGEEAQIRSARRDDGVHVHVRGDIADGHRRNVHLVTNPIGEGRLEQPAVRRFLIGHGLTRRDVDDIAAVLLEHRRDRDSILRFHSARYPVDGADAHAHRFVRRPHTTARIENRQRKAHTIFERSTVLITSLVGERGDERRQQIPVRHVNLD